MKSIRQAILQSSIILTCVFLCKVNAFAQIDTVAATALITACDDIEVVPPQKFDFGVPNPNADRTQVVRRIDYLKTASTDEILKSNNVTPGTVSTEQMRHPMMGAGMVTSAAEEVLDPMMTAGMSGESEYASVMAASVEDSLYAVGQIPYNESVTAFGGRVYDIPIMITPLAGFAPQVSLQYNSQSGNGLAGYGWSIAGLSSITLTDKTLYYNGKVAPASINDSDAAYSMDGIPLVQNDEPSLATEYPLATAKGHIIVQKHRTGDFVSHFTALYPDGSKATFGMPSDTIVRIVYPITSWEDKLGNKVTYNYNRNLSTEDRIQSIRFRRAGDSTDTGELKFSYARRTDRHTRYRDGLSLYQGCILKSITSESRGRKLCTYQLTHQFRGGVNLLTSVWCENASGEQLHPLSFAYGSADSSGESAIKDFVKCDNLFLSTYFSSSSDVKFIYNRGKFMADSYNDGVMILPKFSNYGIVATKRVLFNEYHQYGSMYASDQVVLVAPRLSYLSEVDNSITAGPGFQCIEAADIDGDGVDEIVKVNFNGTSLSSTTTTLLITVYGCDATTGAVAREKLFNVMVNGIVENKYFVSPMCRSYHFGDFNGDGRAQLLTISYNEDPLGNSRTSYASLIDPHSGNKISESSPLSLGLNDDLLCIDLDGDGRTEVCHVTASGVNVYNLNGTTFSLTKAINGLTSADLSSKDYCLLDINGDGYVDIARKPAGTSSEWRVYQYTGNRFISKVINIPGTTKDSKCMFFDVNNDGLPDLVSRNGSSVTIYLNENGTYRSGNSITSSLPFAETAEFVPCNTLGYNMMSDFIAIEGCYVNLYKFSQDMSASRLLTKFTNSLGATTINNYANMASSDYVYSIDKERTYNSADGYAKCRFPLYLLYNTQSYLTPSLTGSGQLTNLWYTYSDACIHKRGLGFRGFGKMRTTDFMSATDKEFVTIETRDPEKMGVTTRLALGHRMTQDTPYDITDYEYDSHATTYGKLDPRLTKVVHIDTLSKRESAALYEYDDYGYPTSVKMRRTTGGKGRIDESQEIEYIHKVSPNNYCIGSIRSEKVTHFVSKYRSSPTLNSNGTGSNSSNRPALGSYWIEKQVYTYNDAMLPLTRIDSVGTSSSKLNRKLQTRWTYDMYGNILSEMQSQYDSGAFLGKTYTYDEDGICLLTSTDELGLTTTFSDYNKFGKPASQTDHKGRKTSYTYDGWGKLISMTEPDGTLSSTSSSWGGIGCYKVTQSVTGQPGQIIHYDAAGREVRRGTQRYSPGQWIFTDTVYGRNGQVQKVSLPFKSTTGAATLWNTYEYDEYARPVSYTHASGNATTWVYDGATTTETKNGVWSAKTVNSNGQVVKVEDAGGTIKYSLRADGQPSEIFVTGGLSTTFEYDRYGRRKKIVDPSAGTQTDSTVFNANGSSFTIHTNPKGAIVTSFDRFGRRTKVERAGEYATNYLYSQDGLLTSEVSSNGTSKTYSYDSLDRLQAIKETVPDGKWLKQTLTYTSGSNVNTIEYESQSGPIATESFAYVNGTNIRIGVGNTHVRLINGENEFGQPTLVYTGGLTRTYSYNAYGMPTGRTMGSVMDCSYSFDPISGNLLSRTDNLRNRTEVFGYDSLNRLTAMDGRQIAYSDNGNITGIDSVGEMAYSDSSRPYQLTSLSAEDDVVPSRVQNVTYTCYGRPSIIIEGGRSAAFTYNGDGERVKMNVSDGVTSVLSRYCIGKRYEMDVTPAGTVERLYLGGDAYSAPAVYVREGSEEWNFYCIGRDYLGNITHIATSDGTLVEENSYDPWGRLRNPETNEIYTIGAEPELMLGRGYTGHEHLSMFGLINMNARLYDPLLGRFLSPDPYVQMPDFTQNFNRYSYCLNNPLVYVDENGEFVFTTAVIVGICVGAAIGVAAGAYQGYKIAERKGLEGSAKVWTIIGGGLIGGVAGGASGIAGAYVGAGMAAAGIGGFYAGAATGAAAGATAGFINGFGMATLETGNVMYGLKQGVVQGVIGAGTGALVGGLIQGTASAVKGNNFWDGSAPISQGYETSYKASYETTVDKPNTNGEYSVYEGVDPKTKEVKYIGITKRDPNIRFQEHLNSETPRAGLEYSVLKSGLSGRDARVMEQLLINKYGLDNLYNKINSIAPKFWSKYNIY